MVSQLFLDIDHFSSLGASISISMSIVNLNVRGLGRPKKRLAIRKLVKK